MKRLGVLGRAITVTPLGLALLLMAAVGVMLVLLASGATAKVGFGVAVVGVLAIIGGNLPAGLLGGRGFGQGGAAPRRRLKEASPPEPEYIESTAPVSEDAWRREQQRYRERDQNR
ncbi:MAG: hypothetical protein ACXVUE_02765 [Solirubrobacteraceae bacterium]